MPVAEPHSCIRLLTAPVSASDELLGWISTDQYVSVLGGTRKRSRCSLLLRPHDVVWLPRHRLMDAAWPPAHQLLAARHDALSASVLQQLVAAAKRCSACEGGWAPHDRLGYEFGALDDALPASARTAVIEAVSRLSADTWGAEFAAQNPPCMAAGSSYFLRYDAWANPPPPHLDVKALPGLGAQTANAIVYLSGGGKEWSGGETVLLGVDDGTLPANSSGDTLISPARGKLVVWRSYTDSGVLDPRALHTSRRVVQSSRGRGGEEEDKLECKLLLTVSLRRQV
jgi:hypothetical protein